MGVQGFPTLKIVRPSAKSGKPVVEDYQGARTAKAIVDTVVDKIPNHVKRITDKNLDEFLAEGNETAKAVLFTEKGTTSALLRALAVDFLSSITVAQIRNKESIAVEMFGITSFPTIVLLPGGEKEPFIYEGEMKKEPLVTFFKQVAEPNPDPAPKAAKSSSSKKPKSAKSSSSSASSSFSEASAAHQSAEASEAAASATKLSVEEDAPIESPNPEVPVEEAPIQVPDKPPVLPEFTTSESLTESCLGEKTGTCVLLLLPSLSESDAALPEAATTALSSLSELADKHNKRHAHLFPIRSVPGTLEGAVAMRSRLGLSDSDVEVIAINGRRGWWRRYSAQGFGTTRLEDFIDSIRLGEGEKQKLPQFLLAPEMPVEDVEHDEL